MVERHSVSMSTLHCLNWECGENSLLVHEECKHQEDSIRVGETPSGGTEQGVDWENYDTGLSGTACLQRVSKQGVHPRSAKY